MDTKVIPNLCPKCQTPLPPDAPQGLCPKCLFAAVATPTEAGQPASRPAAPPIEEIAAAFPQLEILEFIGQGGMGFVFKARQPKLDRLVALKILPQALAADPTFAERFNREAKLLARLSHPGIVTVHDFGVATGRADLPVRQGDEAAQPHRPTPQFYYLLMEFVDGVNLRQAMQAGRFTPEQALAIVPKICEALQFAHNEGILHRDIKPENILLDAKGRVKIADFGIAKLMGNEGRADLLVSQTAQQHRPTELNLTEAGKTLGSPNYMAPEQLEHPGEVDHRADIYSLGVVFYEMLTGELPLGPFAPPSQKSAADPRVDEVVLRALQKEKTRRHASADEVRTQVETIVTGSSGRESAQSESKRQKTEGGKPAESLLTSAATNQEPRFSRTAIVGACWTAFFLAFLIFGVLAVTSVASFAVQPVGVIARNTRLVLYAGVLLTLLGLPAMFGTTILGWVAVAQIRRSAGKLYGMWLAVFDGLLFPLLALNLLIGWLVWVVLAAVVSVLMLNGQGTPSTFLVILLSLPIAIPLNRHIIRRVWRVVNVVKADVSERHDLENQKNKEGSSGVRKLGMWIGVLMVGAAILFTPYILNVVIPLWRVNFLKPEDARVVVRGTVTDAATGKPLSGVEIGDYFFIGASARRKTVQRTDNTGRFEFHTWNVRDHHIINAIAIGYIIEARQYPVQPSDGKQEVLMNFILRRGDNNTSLTATAKAPSFGPEKERVLNADLTGANRFLDLDTGKVLSLPPEIAVLLGNNYNLWQGRNIATNSPAQAYLDWIERTGVDVLVQTNTLVVFNATCSIGHGSADAFWGRNWTDWKQLSAADFNNGANIIETALAVDEGTADQTILSGIVSAMQWRTKLDSAGKWTVSLLPAATQETIWLFKTRAGAKGALRFEFAGERSGTAQIRYKLVQSAATTATPVSLPPVAAPATNPTFGQPRRSQSPCVNQTGTNNQSVCVGHDKVDAQYTLFHDGNFQSFTSRGWHDPKRGNWQDDLAITLADGGRTFGFLRESLNPDQLRVNGQDYDLKQGRVLMLNSDGTVRQLPLFPPLAVAQRADQMARLIKNSLDEAGKRNFGPVVERALTGDPQLSPAFLSLHDGSFVYSPTGTNLSSAKAFADWWRGSKADFMAAVEGEKHLLVSLEEGGAKFTEFPAQKWESASAMDVADALRTGSSLQAVGKGGIVSYVLPKSAALPITLAVKSRTGEIGLLQITGFTENPRGMKLRYKLVPEPKPVSSGQSQPAKTGRIVLQPPFIAKLPVGEVELVAVSEFLRSTNPELHVTHNQSGNLKKSWWQADGSLLTQQIPAISGSLNEQRRDLYEIALQVRGQTNGYPGIKLEKLADSGFYPGEIESSTWARKVEDMTFQRILSCEPGLAQVSFRIGVADEPWQTERSLDFSSIASASGEAGNILLSVVTSGDETTVTCQYEQRPDWQTRLIALGPKGEVEPIRQGPFQGVGNNTSETRVFRTADIKDAKLHLQRRPYRWVEFHNVSLKAGQNTAVEVVDDSLKQTRK